MVTLTVLGKGFLPVWREGMRRVTLLLVPLNLRKSSLFLTGGNVIGNHTGKMLQILKYEL